MSHPTKFLSLLLAAAHPIFAVGQDSKAPEPRPRPKSALVVVDVQVGVLPAVWESARVIGNIEKLVDKARQTGAYGQPHTLPWSSATILHKRFLVEPSHRGRGVARQLLEAANQLIS